MPTFRTDITIKMLKEHENRIYIPITDQEATNQFYLYYKKNSLKDYRFIFDQIKNFDWKSV